MSVLRWLLAALGLVVVAYGGYTLTTGTESTPPKLTVLTDGTIEVLEASYGLNCNPAAASNSTLVLSEACNGSESCDYPIRVEVLGDPANGCPKAFSVRWRCAREGPASGVTIPAEAHGKSVELACGANDD